MSLVDVPIEIGEYCPRCDEPFCIGNECSDFGKLYYGILGCKIYNKRIMGCCNSKMMERKDYDGTPIYWCVHCGKKIRKKESFPPALPSLGAHVGPPNLRPSPPI